MNILFLDQFSELGGAQQCLLNLLPGIQARAWRAHVAAPGAGPLMDRVQALGISYHALPHREYANGRKGAGDVLRFALGLPPAVAQLRALVRDLSVDLLYVNGPRVLPAASFAGRGLVFHAHSVVPQPLARFLALRALRRSAAEVIAVSEYAAASWRRSVPALPMHVIYSGVGDASGAEPLVRGLRRDPWRVGFIGRIAPEKGALDFVRAARVMNRTRSGVQFVLCGAPVFSDASYALRVKAESRDLPVAFWGWQDDIPAVLRSLDLVLVPSSAEDSAPRVILEAFSAGVPVVAYSSGGIPELVHSDAGLLVPERTPEALASAAGMLLDHPGQLRAMGLSARRVWAERFQAARYSEEIVRVLERVCPARARKRETQSRPPPPLPRRQEEPNHIRTAAR